MIRGIPSSRFGDLTQGVVLIDTRAGALDPEARVRLDARTAEGTLLGGGRLGRAHFATASFNLARTKLAPGLQEHTGSRISAQLAHRHEGRRITADTRVDFFQVLDDQPSLDTLRKLATGLQVSGDTLLFDATERGPDEEFRLQFEALTQFDAEEKRAAKALLDALILKHQARKWAHAS